MSCTRSVGASTFFQDVRGLVLLCPVLPVAVRSSVIRLAVLAVSTLPYGRLLGTAMRPFAGLKDSLTFCGAVPVFLSASGVIGTSVFLMSRIADIPGVTASFDSPVGAVRFSICADDGCSAVRLYAPGANLLLRSDSQDNLPLACLPLLSELEYRVACRRSARLRPEQARSEWLEAQRQVVQAVRSTSGYKSADRQGRSRANEYMLRLLVQDRYICEDSSSATDCYCGTSASWYLSLPLSRKVEHDFLLCPAHVTDALQELVPAHIKGSGKAKTSRSEAAYKRVRQSVARELRRFYYLGCNAKSCLNPPLWAYLPRDEFRHDFQARKLAGGAR